MGKLSFYPALWAGKLLMIYYRLQGKERCDHAGMASMRICGDFLTHIKKPPFTVAVTGTNGKTTTAHLVSQVLKKQGKTVTYNDWGANHHAGHARCLLPAVNVFNKSVLDCAVVEMDELISPVNVPQIKPDYLIIQNIARDSMLRNAHPYFIHGKIKKACELSEKTKLIINADNPFCYGIGENNSRVYYGVGDLGFKSNPTLINDFPVCPVCHSAVEYEYSNYRHIGLYKCTECGFTRPECDYFVQKADFENNTITVKEPKGVFTYPVNSMSVFNIYNYASVIVLFRETGTDYNTLCGILKDVTPPKSRETSETVNNITVKTQLCKGQNVSATSSTFEYVSKLPGNKCIVLLLDEMFENQGESETAAWIFDTDYEYLNRDDIKQIVVAGSRYCDHRVRLLMAGIPEEKFVCVRDFTKAADCVSLENIDSVFVLHDVNFITNGNVVAAQIKQKIREGS